MADTAPFLHDFGDGLIVPCLSCAEHGMRGWDRYVARERARLARVRRMHSEYARRVRARRARRCG